MIYTKVLDEESQEYFYEIELPDGTRDFIREGTFDYIQQLQLKQ